MGGKRNVSNKRGKLDFSVEDRDTSSKRRKKVEGREQKDVFLPCVSGPASTMKTHVPGEGPSVLQVYNYMRVEPRAVARYFEGGGTLGCGFTIVYGLVLYWALRILRAIIQAEALLGPSEAANLAPLTGSGGRALALVGP